MMASYVILTPVTGPGKDHQKTRFIRDGFSLLAFFFPGIWLLCHRLWLLGIGALLLQGIGLELIHEPALWPAGFMLLLAISVLTAVEGRMLFARSLSAGGFLTDGLVSARNLAEAEEIYLSGISDERPEDIRPVRWDIPNANTGGAHGTALGLIGYDGGR
jgi:Protein of unknown function (DUF2628)